MGGPFIGYEQVMVSAWCMVGRVLRFIRFAVSASAHLHPRLGDVLVEVPFKQVTLVAQLLRHGPHLGAVGRTRRKDCGEAHVTALAP